MYLYLTRRLPFKWSSLLQGSHMYFPIANQSTKLLINLPSPHWTPVDIVFVYIHHLSPTQQLIPYVEDDSSKHDERLASQARPATEERREILEVNKVSCPLGLSRYKCTVRWALESTALYIKSNPNSDSRRREAKKCMTKYSVKTSYILYTILPVLLKY